MIPASVEPCFETRMKISPGRPSSYWPTVTKPLQSASRNSNVRDVRLRGSFSRTGSFTVTTRSTMRSTTSVGAAAARRRRRPTRLLLGHGQRLRDLAVVAVDRDRLEPELPRVDVELLDLLDRSPPRAC